MNDELRRELLDRQAEDLSVRQRLLDAGMLRDGYNREMRVVHERNAARLREIIAADGWPSASLVGDDGAEAAWLIVQHAIGDPDLQRLALKHLDALSSVGELPRWQYATLYDRICFFEGRPQRYGTQLDLDDDGNQLLYETEDLATVDERRRSVGLGPLWVPAGVPPEGPRTREQVLNQRAEFQQWLREVGWRTA